MKIYERLLSIANGAPSAICLKTEEKDYTYSDFLSLIEHFSRKIPLEAKRVGIVMKHGPQQLAAIFAALKSGLAYIIAEPDFPSKRIEKMMGIGQADCLFLDAPSPEFCPSLPQIGIWSPDQPKEPKGDHGLAYILFTSGSTGKPKGVMIAEDNILGYVKAFQNEFHLRNTDTFLQHSVCTFDIFTEEVFASLLNGATLAIPNDETKQNTERLLKFCNEKEVTVVSSFPYLFKEWNSRDDLPGCFRLFISGGDVLRASYVDKIRKRFRVYNTYGPSETTVCCTYCDCTVKTPNPDGTFPIGKGIEGYQVYLEKDGQRINKPNQIGEIIIQGAGVGLGYVGNLRQGYLTIDGVPSFRSGDLAYYDEEGDLNFLKRNDAQVMIYGKRVEPMEVENLILNKGLASEAAVVAVYDEEGLAHLKACLVSPFKEEQIKDELSAYLPPYMIPEHFVFLPKMPLTENGKLDRRSLRINLRKFGLNEAEAWADQRQKVLKEVFACYSVYSNEEQAKIKEGNKQEFIEGCRNLRHVAYGLFDGERIVGSGDICYQKELPSPENKSGKVAFLMNVYVDESLRKRGFGRLIMEKLMEEAKQAGVGKIYLESSRAGRPLYQKLGFELKNYYMFYRPDGKR